VNSPATHHLIDLSETTVAALKRVALGVAVIAVVVAFAGRRSGWLDYRPGGAAFDTLVSPVFIGVFVVAALIALRWEIVGGALAAFAGAALVAFATNQLEPVHAAIVVALFAVPAAASSSATPSTRTTGAPPIPNRR
jgi:hypothetical protein